MKNKTKAIFVTVLILMSVIYIGFNYYYISKNRFEFIGQESILYVNEVYGFWNEEKLGNSELRFRWMNDLKALKRVKIRGNKILISIFCLKPDIAEEPVSVKIYSNDRLIGDLALKDNEVIYLEGDVAGMGYELEEYLDIRFEIDSLWSPVDYGIENDTRKLGIAVGNIDFTDE